MKSLLQRSARVATVPQGGSDMAGPVLVVRNCERCNSSYVADADSAGATDDLPLCPTCMEGWKRIHGSHKDAQEFDAVNRPKHYVDGRKYEPIDVAEDWGLDKDAYLFNTLKYISRAGRKGDLLEDLKKSRFYLDRRIKRLEMGAEQE